MNLAVACSLLISLSVCFAQQTLPLSIRSIRVKLVSPSLQPATPIGIDVITKALKRRGINLAIQERFDPGQLDKAGDVIRDLYGETGRKVRVERLVTQLWPKSVEVTFDVIELCDVHTTGR